MITTMFLPVIVIMMMIMIMIMIMIMLMIVAVVVVVVIVIVILIVIVIVILFIIKHLNKDMRELDVCVVGEGKSICEATGQPFVGT